MSPTLIAAGVGLVLLGLLAVTGKLLLNAHEQIGQQGIVIAEKEAIIKQKQHDAELSDQLATLQTKVEMALRGVSTQTKQAINAAPDDNAAATAAIGGVQRLRAAGGQRPASP